MKNTMNVFVNFIQPFFKDIGIWRKVIKALIII